MLTTYDEVLPLVVPRLRGCPDALALQAVRTAARDLCNHTWVWQKELTAMDVVEDQAQYGLDPAEVTDAVDAQAEPTVRAIAWVEVEGAKVSQDTYDLVSYTGVASVAPAYTPEFAVEFDDDHIPASDITDGLVVKVVLVPHRTSTYISKFILDAHADTIASGAMASLLVQRRRPWYDPDYAREMQFEWSRGLATASKERYTGRKDASLCVNLNIRPWE